jgi:hypothetical protein
MFKNNPFAGVLPFRNGGSVPSIGGTPTLSAALAAVSRIEDALQAARSQAKAAARREGKSVRHLFDGHPFVARSSAEGWVDRARQEGRTAGMRFLLDTILEAQGLDPKEERKRAQASIEQSGAAAKVREGRWNALMKQAGFFEAVEAGDHERAGRIMFEMHDTLTAADAHVLPRAAIERRERDRVAATGKATGAAIVAAGRRARMSADAAGEVRDPQKGSLAAAIIAAGKKRRNEV